MVQSPFQTGAGSRVTTGPAGRAMAQPLEPDLLAGLQHHLTMERQASAAYWALALWFAERELRGFAKFLQQEAVDEQHHAGLFADYLQGCSSIVIRDPYIRAFHQVRNLVEFLRMVNEITPVGDEVSVHLITGSDQETLEKQVENLGQVQDSFAGTSTPFTWEVDASPNFHARSITADHGWKITLDRGLDLFQWFEFSPFNAAAVMQEARMVKGCEVSYIRTEG